MLDLIYYLNTALMQVVEIPRGSKVKYELDKKTGLIKVLQINMLKLFLGWLLFL